LRQTLFVAATAARIILLNSLTTPFSHHPTLSAITAASRQYRLTPVNACAAAWKRLSDA